MSYQVLARKWRPQNFKQMVGQEHVLQALIHALESGRLHHAYLFTGTRGVGKTTIGRILAKCLSCQKGVTAEPCGECGACTAITEGRYVDLIEIDAASRTKVEDMRELLDNVQYAPSEGSFKIYLIDEVHMLSQSSFNALLKTLEEPPEHVKFLFATTDPQKLPVTILSRCLQFNLKNMSPERIVAHLKHVLQDEQVVFDESALWALARAADGSMRDALSLTDQAIAYGNHELTEVGVTAMLGTVDQKRVYRLLDALIAGEAAQLLDEVKALSEFAPDYGSVLASLSSILHRVAIEQAVPNSTDNSMGDRDQIVQYARGLSAEDVQLFYQIALVSRQDLAITPEPRAGLEMALLRMMAFQLEPMARQSQTELPSQATKSTAVSGAEPVHEVTTGDREMAGQDAGDVVAPERSGSGTVPSYDNSVESAPVSAPVASGRPVAQAEIRSEETGEQVADLPPLEAYDEGFVPESVDSSDAFTPMDESTEVKKKTVLAETKTKETSAAPVEAPAAAVSGEVRAEADIWPALASRLNVSGMTQNLLLNMAYTETEGAIRLNVEAGHFRLLNANHEARIREAFQTNFPNHKIEFVEGLLAGQETPMMWRERKRASMLQAAKDSMKQDPNVKHILDVFDGVLLEDSIQAHGELH